MAIIKPFIFWAYNQGANSWQTDDDADDKKVVKRTISFGRCLFVGGMFANLAIYNTFLIGIWNFRTQEILDMKRVPFVLKLTLSTAASAVMCHTLWTTNLYDPHLYRLSIKYRHKFDDKFD
jgi:hypothetical protein